MEQETYKEWKAEKKSKSDPITKQEEIADRMRQSYIKEYRDGAPFGADESSDAMSKAENVKIDLNSRESKVKVHQRGDSDIWTETNTKNAQEMVSYMNGVLENGDYGDVSRVIVIKHSSLNGLSAYDNKRNYLFIAEELMNKEWFSENVDASYFAARNMDEVIKHELGGHKAHWAAVRRYYLNNADRFEDINEAKIELESKLRKYVKERNAENPMYILQNISKNAADGLDNKNSLNELIADGMVIGEQMRDKELLKLIKEVIGYDGSSKH